MVRVTLPLVIVVALLAGCATASPDPSEPSLSPSPSSDPSPSASSRPAGTVALEGEIITILPIDSGERRYSLRVAGQGDLAIAITGATPPPDARGVIVAVPLDLAIPADPAELFLVLDALVESSGKPLTVLAYLR